MNKEDWIKNVIILSGGFDPVHKGHLGISKIAIRKFKLKKVIWLITKQNPLKQKPYLSIKTRISLSQSMTKSQKKIFVTYLDDKIKSINRVKFPIKFTTMNGQKEQPSKPVLIPVFF